MRPAPVRLQSLPHVAIGAKGDFANPKEFPLQNVYDLNLTTTDVKTPHGPEVGVPAAFHLLGYNGLPCGQTIRVRRGSTLRIHLKNNLKGGEAGAGDVGSVAPPNAQAEKPHGLDVTNLHTHGLHVSPADPSDNILLCRKPQEEQNFIFQIPVDHPSGTFWYHPHNHGTVAYQLSNGVAGALIVEGTKNDGIHDLDDIPEIAAAEERIFLFQLYNFRARNDPNAQDPGVVGKDAVGWIDATTIYNVEVDKSRSADIQVPAEDEDPNKTVTLQATAINGQINPTLTFAPGEVQRWRLIHAGWDLDRKLLIVDQNDDPTDDFSVHEIALDGLATGRMERKIFVEIAPGQRSDVLIKGPMLPPGIHERVYHLKQTAVDGLTAPHGTPQDPLFLAKVVVTGRPKPMSLPDPKEVARCRPLPDIRKTELSGTRTIRFQASDGDFTATPKDPPFYTINNLAFHNQQPIPLVLNTAEEWTLTAERLSHPFHIHVNPFQIVRYTDPNNNTTHMNVWRDTLYIKKGETYVIRSRFLDFPGESVFHCHILDHEDQGMMVPLTFSNQGQALPAQEICKELRPPATKLQVTATPAPALRLPDTAGVTNDLSKYRGRTVALVFFQGAECARLRRATCALVREVRGSIGLDAEVVAVSSRKFADPARALKALGVTDSDRFHLLVDETHRAFRDFGCFASGPQHGLFLIDGAGVIRSRYVGETPFGDTEQVIERIRQLASPGRQTALTSFEPNGSSGGVRLSSDPAFPPRGNHQGGGGHPTPAGWP